MEQIKPFLDIVADVLIANVEKIRVITQGYNGWEKWLQAEIYYAVGTAGHYIEVEQKIWVTSESLDFELIEGNTRILIELKCKYRSDYVCSATQRVYGSGGRGRAFKDLGKLDHRKPAYRQHDGYVVYVRGNSLLVIKTVYDTATATWPPHTHTAYSYDIASKAWSGKPYAVEGTGVKHTDKALITAGKAPSGLFG